MDDIKVNQNPKLGSMDRPNSYIGRSLPRENAKKHLEGGGQFVDDLVLPRMLHVAFLRSPFAHAEIKSINVEEAKKSPGVFDVYTAKEIDEYCTPWVGTLGHLGEMRSPEQTPLAKKIARWQGEPIAVVIANNRAQAEDALELIEVDWEEKDAQVDMETALDDNAVVIHPELGSNLFWTRTVNQGDVNQAFETSHAVVQTTLDFARHTGVTLESRGIVADWNKSEGKITIYHNGQAPHMMQHIIAKHLEVNEGLVRIVSRDVGGSFGIKVHVYPDEMAVAAISKKLGRPIKFIADRLESFTTDIHARCHKISGKLGVDKEGKILAMEINDLSGIGPFSMYPRTSAIETNQVLNLSGAPYVIPNYKAVGTVVFQNKTPMCQYRAVGHPIAVAITEALIDKAANKIDIGLSEIRKKNFIPDNAYPNKTPSGVPLEDLSHEASMDKLLTMMNIQDIEKEKIANLDKNVLCGYGVISMCEVTNPSPLFYGVGGAHISSQDGASIRLEGSGAIHLSSSITEQGQGTEAIMKQIAADQLGVSMDSVRVTLGDTDATPYGGGTWASRGAGIGGEAVLKAARILKDNILDIAAAIMQTDKNSLDVENNTVIRKNGGEGITLQQLAETVYYRGHELPKGTNPELLATASFLIEGIPFVFTNSAMGCKVSIDQDTGIIKIDKFWAVEDCGTQINPKLVEEQIRGGVIQGIGGALFEECVYDDQGNMQNATMADYLVPMAYEMPDIIVDHVTTNSGRSIIGAKGAGEAGTGGAPAVIMNAVNNALKHHGTEVLSQPITPEKILRALGKI